MTSQLATASKGDIMEQVLIQGDLMKLSPEQRMTYYLKTCESLGLNPYTKPFDYINLNGRLVLYARKDAAEQLRKNNRISIEKPDIQFQDDWIVVTVVARDAEGRTDSDVGVVNKKDMRGDFGNALMKAVTKAKRRVTLSICGLGMLDETEIDTIPDARPVVVTYHGEIIDERPTPPQPKANGGSVFNPVALLVENGIAENNHEAAAILNKYAPKDVKHDPALLLGWAELYRVWREAGSEPIAAAKNATEGIPFE